VAQADSAESRVALHRADTETALTLARQALGWLQQSHRDDPHLEIMLPAARTLTEVGTDEEKQMIHGLLQAYLALGAAREMNDDVRMRWFRSAAGRELVELAGPMEVPSPAPAQTKGDAPGMDLDERENRLLRLLVQGKSNHEISQELKVEDTAVAGMLSALYARVGTSSRAETTAFAIRAV
jgi:DNA-binding NarL/FixJ family response regulator